MRPRGTSFLLIVGLGLVGVVALQLTYNVAITRLPLGIALLIEYLAPVLVVLWVRFVRHEEVRPRMWLAVALALVGLAVVSRVWNGLTFDGLGVVMALLAAVSFAAYFLLAEHNVGVDDPLRVILWAFVVATVVMNLIQPIWESPGLGGSTSMLGRLDGVLGRTVAGRGVGRPVRHRRTVLPADGRAAPHTGHDRHRHRDARAGHRERPGVGVVPRIADAGAAAGRARRARRHRPGADLTQGSDGTRQALPPQ